MIAAIGLTLFCPAMSGAVPWTARTSTGRWLRRVQVGRRRVADPAGDGAAQVGEDVAEGLSVDDVVALGTLHEVDAGSVDVLVVGAFTSGYSGDLVEVRCHRSPAKVSTFFLCTSVQVASSVTAARSEHRSGCSARRRAGVDQALGGIVCPHGCVNPPSPTPGCPRSSAITSKSVGREVGTDVGLMYWSRSKRMRSLRPRSTSPAGAAAS